MRFSALLAFASIFVGAMLPSASDGFVPATIRRQLKANMNSVGERILLSALDGASETRVVDAVPVERSDINPESGRLKYELLSLASSTQRGFKSSKKEKERAKEIINELAKMNPTEEPAAPYYENAMNDGSTDGVPTLSGKWTLVYTDAPDITSLDAGPLATAKLGNIGQECSPPFIKNVIEWRKPEWAQTLPLSGSAGSRILQKVCCEAVARPEKPLEVDLMLVGLELVGSSEGGGIELLDKKDSSDQGIVDSIKDGPAGLFRENPVELRGPIKLPFGKFKILYCDSDMRIIKTGQNYFAVNVRDETWF